MLHLFQVNNLLTYNFVLLQDETVAMDYLENQEYQSLPGNPGVPGVGSPGKAGPPGKDGPRGKPGAKGSQLCLILLL